MREPGLLLVHTMIECRGKMYTTAHMNFDDELIMNKTHKCVKSGFFLFTLIRAGKCTLMHNRHVLQPTWTLMLSVIQSVQLFQIVSGRDMVGFSYFSIRNASGFQIS